MPRPGCLRGQGTGRPRPGRDSGAFTLSYVIIVPVFLAGLMVIVQAAAWYLASLTALAAARAGANAARTYNAPPGAGPRAALSFARAAAPGFLLRPAASAAGSTPSSVRITVTGRAPALVPGLVIGIREVVRVPAERFIAVGPRLAGPRRAGPRRAGPRRAGRPVRGGRAG
ncbi:MAG: hypothetical protein ACYCVZ_20170 [Streptosporangiaceae bacterium]